MARAAKRGQVGKRTRKSRGSVKVTRNRVIFKLGPREIAKAKKCLERSGEIRIAFKELRVTKLPTVLDDGKLID